MDANLALQPELSQTLGRSLTDGWRELSSRYLPVMGENSFWRYSRGRDPHDPEQGWKLHVSATVLTANEVLKAIGPFLQRLNVMFKAPVTLQELSKINCGVYYGYTLVGKCFTVYPQTTQEALLIANRLHRLTAGLASPAVPFDRRFKSDSCVHYRYGAFREHRIENANGSLALAIRTPKGDLVPDIRDCIEARPDWVANPFPVERDFAAEKASPLQTTYHVFRALTQRGKGGVYQAADLSSTPPRVCIIKEGRKNGEPYWDGRDGFWRVRNEERVLRSLRTSGVNVPEVYSSFEVEGNSYLAIEFVAGKTLQELLDRRARRMTVKQGIKLATQLCSLLAKIHASGWVWRDCKPANVLVTAAGELRPLDFEGACSIDDPDPTPWGTPSYVPSEFREGYLGVSGLPQDLYALGVVIYHILTGAFPQRPFQSSFKLRPTVPPAVRELVAQLLNPEPVRRPPAESMAKRFAKLQSGGPNVAATLNVKFDLSS